MRAAVAGSAALVALGAWAFMAASQGPRRSAAPQTTSIVIRDGRCSPDTLALPAGPAQFRIVNQTDRTIEWEILDGVMVVEERENILPGMSRDLRAKLAPGDYAMTCGLLSNPRGTLRVRPSGQDGGAPKKPGLVAFLGPLAEYRVFLARQSAALTSAAQALAAAVADGDVAQSRAAFRQARRAYAEIEPAAKRFADLDSALDPPAGAFEKREQDRAFVGFHRIEYALFADRPLAEAAPFAERLAADAQALEARLRETKFMPDAIAENAARLVRILADSRIASGADDWSHADLDDFDANLAGVARMTGLLKPVASQTAPEAFAAIEARLEDARAALASLRGPGGYPSYADVDAPTRARLAQTFGALADALEKLNAAIGLG
jgi:iron uptake system component EfeO